MAEIVARPCTPIDTVLLTHKALRTEATRIEKLVRDMEEGGSLQPFNLAFNAWAMALVFHAEQENKYLLDHLNHYGEASGGDSGGLPSQPPSKNGSNPLVMEVRAAMVAQEEELHQKMVEKIEEVLSVLQDDIGSTSVIRRTIQHLYRQIVALRIALENHLDTEEALVLPRIEENLDEPQQLLLAENLLTDSDSEDPRWMIEWVSERLTPEDRTAFLALDKSFAKP